MNPIKMLGLAALSVLTAMAFVSTSSAIAESTALCKEDTVGACPKGQLITHVHEATQSTSKAKLLSEILADLGQHVHEATLSTSKAKLLSSLANVECDALFLGEVVASKPLLEILGNFTYTNCETQSGTGCTVVEVSKDATVQASKSGHELAKVTYKYEINVSCGALFNCTYNGEGLEGHGLGPLLAAEENGETRVEEQTTKKVAGILCPENTKLDFLTTPLTPGYITEGARAGGTSTVLCNEDPGVSKEEFCQPVTLVVECDTLFLGDVISENSLGTPLLTSVNFTYSNCETTSGTACEVKEVSAHAFINVLKLGHELGDVPTYTLEWNVHCGALINCTYNGIGLLGHALGPLLAAEENGETRVEEEFLNKVGGAYCPKLARLDILTTPLEPTYIAN